MGTNYAGENWWERSKVEETGKPFKGWSEGFNGWDEAMEKGKIFLTKTAAARINHSVKKNDTPDAFRYNNNGPDSRRYMPLYDRTDFFNKHERFTKEVLDEIDNLHLERKSKLKEWGFKTSRGLKIAGYVEIDYFIEAVFDIAGTEQFEEKRLERLMSK